MDIALRDQGEAASYLLSKSHTTTIEGVTLADLFFKEQFHVNVHAEAPGSEEPTALACADLQDDEATSEHDNKEEHQDH